MKKIDTSFEKLKKHINQKTNNNADIVFKNVNFFEYKLNIIFCESLTNRDLINNVILKYLETRQLFENNGITNIISYLENNIPGHKVSKINTYEDLFYNLLSGFSLICVNGEENILAIETKASLNSDIAVAQNETVIKGPKDAFTENYQINIGLIKKRIKSEDLWFDELIVGKYSKTKVGIFHINGLASKELVQHVKNKISNINIDSVMDSNYIIELITDSNSKNVFPTFLSTERPDITTNHLLEGKIVIVVENSQLAIVTPALFSELFHSSEDYYQKPINANYTRIIRLIAFIITILTPAIYIAVTTYNHEAIPTKLLVSFSIQRDGVPFPAIIEGLFMLMTFEILKETDTRIPNVIGSSLSIVGALVLGEAAVTAGIVSPIMVIVIAITSISGFIISYLDAINGIRWWRLLFLIAAALAGIVGIIVAGLIFIINISSIKTLGIPYLTPVTPTITKDLGDTILVTNKRRFFKRKSYLAQNNITRGKKE